MIGLAYASLIASAAVTPAAPPHPAMWIVRDADTTIYLFGTFHALDPNTRWFEGSVRNAFAAADELVLETVIPTARPLPAAVRPRLSALQSPAISTGGSFLASTRMALSAGKGQGMRFELGADATLERAAALSDKPVLGLETLQGQYAMFERVPAGPQQPSASPRPAVTMGQLASVMGVMQQSWSRGDGEVFAVLLDDMRANSPAAYRTMFVQRNAMWAQWIARRLQRPGTAFVAVGAGHLAGSDSVQNKLAMLGIRSGRVY
jgi:uncharacterized protein YbaP (TraB family)